jgi:trk system potassium uptake protein TrkA
LPDQQVRILEVRISHSSPSVGRTVKDIQLPRGSLLVALQHKFKAKVPAAEDRILAGDRIVVLVNEAQEKALLERLI